MYFVLRLVRYDLDNKYIAEGQQIYAMRIDILTNQTRIRIMNITLHLDRIIDNSWSSQEMGKR